MQQEEQKTKKKNQKQIDYLFPGIYQDEQMAVYQVKAAKYKKINYCKLPTTIIHEYDKKINLFENKQNKLEIERQSLIREQSKTPNKAEILNKIITQIQTHLSAREIEIFEKQHCDTPVAALEKKKSMFFQAKSHLQLLEKMGTKIQKERNQQKSKFYQGQCHSLPNSPGKKNSRSTSLDNKKNEEHEELKNQLSDRIQRIQSKVNQQMEKLGLKSISISPDTIQLPYSSRKSNIQNLKKDRTNSQQILSNDSATHRGSQTSQFKRFRMQFCQDQSQPKDFKSLIKYCNSERSDIKKLNKDIKKKRRAQFRKFQIISKELSTVGELGFDGLKNKYFIK